MSTLDLSILEREVAPESPPPDALPDWLDIIVRSAVSAPDLRAMPITLREAILGDWLRQADLGFIFGPRGLGKTWLSMHFAFAIASGGIAGPWSAPKSRRCLVVDGEMALDQTQQRHEALAGQPSDNLLLLHHEVSFERTGKTVNLTNPLAQDALLQYCVRAGIEVMFLDNLSCLFRGVAENDADSWELVLPWLLELRRHNIAVVIIHHAGRAGHMRGSSRREDAANWIIRLSEPQDYGAPSTGARFLARFVKNRNCTEESAPPLEWHFVKQGAAQVRVTHRHLDTLAVFRQWVADGLTSASDIAQEMDLSKGMVSRLASAAWRKAGSRRRAASTPWPSLPTSPCPMPMPDPPPARLSVYPLWRINGKRG